MKPAVLLLLAAATLHFDITDARGRKPNGVTLEAGNADESGWYELKVVTKGKGSPVLIWPYDGKAKPQDGPGEIPAIVIEKGDAKALSNTRVLAAVAAAELLGVKPDTGLEPAALGKALDALTASDDPFAKGVALLRANKPIDALDPLARALRERERQLTRVPSEIYPAAILYGRGLLQALKFDDAAVAFLKALKQKPGDPVATQLRSEALEKAGKGEAR